MAGKPSRTELSIVIPCYNAGKTIGKLLDTVAKSKNINKNSLEIIAVDDSSKDDTLKRLQKASIQFKYRDFARFLIIELKENSGPAKARNIGVKYAKGREVLFLDSDVEVYDMTIYEILKSFRDDKDLFAMTGVWDRKQKRNRFFPKFKALRDWSYWINERDPKHYYYLFSTRIAAINRGLFLRLGGFDTTYKAALIEDIELTYRIAKRYAVVFNPKARVRHEFEDFLPIAKKYFLRSYYWSKLYRERKKFDPVATTSKEAVSTISAAGMLLFFLLYLIVFIFMPSYIWVPLWGLFMFIILHLFTVRKFLAFCLKEEGAGFAAGAFIVGIALYTVIFAGALVSIIEEILKPDSSLNTSKV